MPFSTNMVLAKEFSDPEEISYDDDDPKAAEQQFYKIIGSVVDYTCYAAAGNSITVTWAGKEINKNSISFDLEENVSRNGILMDRLDSKIFTTIRNKV